MEYILISDAKLKIICEKSDLSQYDLRAEALEYSDADTRKFLEDILEYAKRKLGFETKLHKILVQIYPSRDGGCEIFISRLTPSHPSEEGSSLSEEKDQSATPQKKRERVFFFKELNHLLDACKRLLIKDFDGSSSAFYLDGKGYFLSIELDCELEEYRIFLIDEYSFIYEYGEPQNSPERIPYLKEYAKCLCPSGAIEILGKI